MTENCSRWLVPLFGFHHGISWVLFAITLVQLHAPWVAAQTQLPPPPTGNYSFGSKIRASPTMVITLVCILSTLFVMVCVSVYVHHCVERRVAASLNLEAYGVGAGRRSWRRAARGLDAAVIDAFPTFIYSEVKGLKIGKGSVECAVCLNQFEDDETLRLLPKCSHVFHPNCIDAWLSSHITCPVCRANLVLKPGETRPVSLLSHDPDWDSTFPPEIHDRDPQNVNLDRVADDFIVGIQSPEVINTIQTPNQDFPAQSIPRKKRITGKFWRSCATSHSLVQPGENCERFTLRLPEDVWNQLLNSGLSRTKSCVAFPRARSCRQGYRSNSLGTGHRKNFYYYERFDRDGRPDSWGLVTTPPFFSRAGSARSPKVVGGGEASTATPKTLLKSVTSPLHRPFERTRSNKENMDPGERSCDRLRLDGQV